MSLCICIVSSYLYVHAQEVSTEDMLDRCMNIGQEFLNDYYYTIEMKQDLDMSKYSIKDEVGQYIKLKNKIMKEVSEKKYGEIAYTFTTVSCYNYRFLDDGIEIIFNVSVRNKCSGSDEVNESLQQVRLGFNYYKDSIVINDYFEYTDFDKYINYLQAKEADSDKEKYNNRLIFTDELIAIVEKVYNTVYKKVIL